MHGLLDGKERTRSRKKHMPPGAESTRMMLLPLWLFLMTATNQQLQRSTTVTAFSSSWQRRQAKASWQFNHLQYSAALRLLVLQPRQSSRPPSSASTTIAALSSESNNNNFPNKKKTTKDRDSIHNKNSNSKQSGARRGYAQYRNNNNSNNKPSARNNKINSSNSRSTIETVAIIGGGIAGLSAAQVLSSSLRVTVYDTGRLRAGGRCATRLPGDVPKDHEDDAEKNKQFPVLSQYCYDHAAQIIVVPSPTAATTTTMTDFAQQVQEWQDNNILRRFPVNSVYNIRNSRNQKAQFEVVPNCHEIMCYGVRGMQSIPAAMMSTTSRRFDVHQDVWVSPSNGVKWLEERRQWRLQAQGRVLGYYDAVVIAHNGKCADRLMSNTPARDIHSLLRVRFAPTVAIRSDRMTLNSIYSLTVAVQPGCGLSAAVPETFIGGFIHDHVDLEYITCQTRKYQHLYNEGNDHAGKQRQPAPELEVWTILSSASFAKQYKEPQEFIPDEANETVTRKLLQAVQQVLGMINTSQDGANDNDDAFWKRYVVEHRLQLWGAAVPLNVWRADDNKHYLEQGFLYDPSYHVGVCGDWLVEPSIAGAWTSGRRLGQYMIQQHEGSTCRITPGASMTNETSGRNNNDERGQSKRAVVGLPGSFQRSAASTQVGLAAFPPIGNTLVSDNI